MPTTDGGPKTQYGKAISSRNATTHGLFARDVVLPSLGEDPEGYTQLQAEWTKQLVPRNLLEQHYVEKIAAASWRLRRLHRWQAQLFEDDTLSEDQRLDRLNAVLRHETALHRQIDTAVKLLHKDVPQLYARRLRDQVLEDLHVTERECRDEPETDLSVSLETSNRLYQLKKATTQAANELSEAPLDTAEPDVPTPDAPADGSTRASMPFPNREGSEGRAGGVANGVANAAGVLNTEICRNELPFLLPLPLLSHSAPLSHSDGGGAGGGGSENPSIYRVQPRGNPPGERCPS